MQVQVFYPPSPPAMDEDFIPKVARESAPWPSSTCLASLRLRHRLRGLPVLCKPLLIQILERVMSRSHMFRLRSGRKCFFSNKGSVRHSKATRAAYNSSKPRGKNGNQNAWITRASIPVPLADLISHDGCHGSLCKASALPFELVTQTLWCKCQKRSSM